ncbi:MAG TPA: hypothetical protein VGN20_20630 [Mucilaginibacter sp.]|jgi:hypothetical protein
MINFLNQKPVVGMLGGMGSGILYVIKTLLTDDDILKWIAGAGIWFGLFVAILTVCLRVMEIWRKFKEPKKQ